MTQNKTGSPSTVVYCLAASFAIYTELWIVTRIKSAPNAANLKHFTRIFEIGNG